MCDNGDLESNPKTTKPGVKPIEKGADVIPESYKKGIIKKSEK